MSFVLVIQLRVTMLNNRNYSESRYTQKNLPGPYSMTEEVLQERAKKVNAGRFITQAYAGVVGKQNQLVFHLNQYQYQTIFFLHRFSFKICIGSNMYAVS